MKHILFAASESAPFIKTGGLGSVLGSLPKELNKLDMEVSLVVPGYECIPKSFHDRMEDLVTFPVHLGWREGNVTVAKLVEENVTCYFLKNSFYYCGSQPYNDIWLDIEKYAFFGKAVLEMLAYLELPVDIIHCHDWQTGLIPVFLREMYSGDPYFARIKTIMTIHNLKFQGITDIPRMKDITGLGDHVFTYDKMENHGDANMLKGGIAYADYVTTVSNSYAREIMTTEYGEGLDTLLYYRKNRLCGIVNGIDWNTYNPETDPYLESHYNADNFETLRGANKGALQRKTGLPVREDAFTMGIVSRLTEQKGYDLLDWTLDDVFFHGGQLFVLGSGEGWVEDIFRRYKERFPDQVYINGDYNDEIAKAIYSGCDITLMPSRFEPCGLNQLMALRYGCLPLVRATGGLRDTVLDDGMVTGNGTGFVFESYDKEAFYQCLDRARKMYEDHPDCWKARIKQGMEKDFSWKTSALAYEKLYLAL